MKTLGLALVVLVLATTACGAGGPKPSVTPDHVAALLRDRWGSTKGMPSFDYSCTRADDGDSVFTCFASDANDMVRVASFDVVCDGSKCTWKDYPAYVG